MRATLGCNLLSRFLTCQKTFCFYADVDVCAFYLAKHAKQLGLTGDLHKKPFFIIPSLTSFPLLLLLILVVHHDEYDVVRIQTRNCSLHMPFSSTCGEEYWSDGGGWLVKALNFHWNLHCSWMKRNDVKLTGAY